MGSIVYACPFICHLKAPRNFSRETGTQWDSLSSEILGFSPGQRNTLSFMKPAGSLASSQELAAIGYSPELHECCPYQSTAVYTCPQLITPVQKMSIPVHSCPYLSTALYTCPQFSVPVHTCPHLSIPVHTCPYLSTLVHKCPQLSILVHNSLHLSTTFRTCPHLSIPVQACSYLSTIDHTCQPFLSSDPA